MEAAATIKEPIAKPAVAEDRTGRSRMVSNVLFTWGGQIVYFISGFIMPRMIDHKLGQDVLGVWDFSWSLSAYFRFVDMGVTSSVNRFVARYWGVNDIEGINRVVSSATFALILASLVILIGTIGAVASLPYWYGSHSLEYLSVTQQSVFCLGVMLAAQTAMGAFNGVLTGCHRWELQTMRNSLWQFIAVVGMLVSLWLGFGLVALAAITAVCQILGQLTMVTLAYRACPGLSIKRSFIHKSTIKELYLYSGKTLLPTISEMLLNETTSVFIISSLGPAALAIFTRPRSLLRQMDSLERKMAMILIPTASSLQGGGDFAEIRKLLVKSVRYSMYLALPMLLVMMILGGQVMYFWMGAGYANALLPAILALGYFGWAIALPILSALTGLNAHGRGGLAETAASICSFLLIVLALGYFHLGLIGVAAAVTLPMIIVNLAYLPWMVCREIGVDLSGFYRRAVFEPLFRMVPFTLCLTIARVGWRQYPYAAAGIIVCGCAALAHLYWHQVLPERLKTWVRKSMGRRIGATVLPIK